MRGRYTGIEWFTKNYLQANASKIQYRMFGFSRGLIVTMNLTWKEKLNLGHQVASGF